MKKFLLIVLSVLLLLPALTGCVAEKAPTPDGSDAVTTAGNSESVSTTEPVSTAEPVTTPAVDKNGYLLDNIPSDTDFENEKIRVLYWNDVEHTEFEVEGISADLVEDAIFTRNANVEYRLGTELEFVGIPGNVNNISKFVSHVEATYTGEKPYDIIGSYSSTAGSLAVRGFSEDMLTLGYPDFAQPWWPSELVDTFTLNGKLYFCSGDLSSNLIYMMYAMFFNKSLIDEYKLDNPYDLVESGNWTFSEFEHMCENVYEDTNNSHFKDSGDIFGYATYWLHLDCLFGSIGIKSVEKDENDLLTTSPSYSSEKLGSFLTYLVDRFDNDNNWYYAGTSGGKLQQQIFADGRSIFMSERIRVCKNVLADTSINYGILPVPKYDLNQTDYITTMAMPYTIYTVPTNSSDTKRAGIMLECLSSEGYRTITPALFELSFKARYSKEAVDAKMFDLVREKVTFDLGRVFNESLAKIPNATLRNMVDSGNSKWASKFDSLKDSLASYINTINDSLQ